jgi:broad specificity phosphatase PhoE
MTFFLLMRHGEPDYSGPYKWDAPGWGKDLAPLTDTGEEQVIQQLEKIREFSPEIVISSPATRALHSSLVLRSKLDVPFRVEFDLHEWVPDRSFQWKTLQEVQTFEKDFARFNGEWPDGQTRPWETRSSMRSRSLAVFRKYNNYSRILAVCHGELIKAVTGVLRIDLAGLVPFELKEH